MLPQPRPEKDAAIDVLGLGQNSVDHVCLVKVYPAHGSKSDAVGYHLLPGGQVATATLSAHRLGMRACYVGAVGDDDLGARASEILRREGVQLELKVVRGALTQFAMIIVDEQGERTIVEHYDPRTVVTAADLRRELLVSARVLHLDITDVPAAIQAARWAREAGTLVSLDIDRLLPRAEELLELVDLLVASEGLPEALGCPDPHLALFTLRRYCRGFVCITRGERGCVALDGNDALWAPAFDVDVVDSTGCGDVFRGALLHGVLQAWAAPRALRFASAAAAIQAGALGAQSGVPSLGQVEAFLASPPPVREQTGLGREWRDFSQRVIDG
jgi:sugar/nucleoside kinase (ribokinase family)